MRGAFAIRAPEDSENEDDNDSGSPAYNSVAEYGAQP